jgi:hypothetical protein
MHAGVWASPYDWYLTQDRLAPVHVMCQRGILQPIRIRGRDKDKQLEQISKILAFFRAGPEPNCLLRNHNLTDHWQIRAKY